MSMLYVKEISQTRSDLQNFVKFPTAIYKNDPNYVPLSSSRQIRMLLGRRNTLLTNGVQCFLMAYEGRRALGRLLIGIDFRSIQKTGKRQGYISLFECVNDQTVADALFTSALSFLKANAVTSVIGPAPALFACFDTGLQVKGFQNASSYLSPYNPPYYAGLFEKFGFHKYKDYHAYDLPVTALETKEYENVLQRAGNRFGYRVDHVNLQKELRQYTRAFARIIAESTPVEWEAVLPTAETLYRELKQIRSLLWTEYIVMAYAQDRPIGFLLVIPDANTIQGFQDQLRSSSALRPFFAKVRIERLHTTMLYVVPDFQNKGVEMMMSYRVLKAARAHGVRRVETSMIDERNIKMQTSVEKIGGMVSKVYRQYQLEL